MGLGGRLCTASEKKNVAIILKAVITESERAAASGLGGAATLFAKEVKKKMKCFCLKITDINTSLVSLRSQFSVGNV